MTALAGVGGARVVLGNGDRRHETALLVTIGATLRRILEDSPYVTAFAAGAGMGTEQGESGLEMIEGGLARLRAGAGWREDSPRARLSSPRIEQFSFFQMLPQSTKRLRH